MGNISYIYIYDMLPIRLVAYLALPATSPNMGLVAGRAISPYMGYVRYVVSGLYGVIYPLDMVNMGSWAGSPPGLGPGPALGTPDLTPI